MLDNHSSWPKLSCRFSMFRNETFIFGGLISVPLRLGMTLRSTRPLLENYPTKTIKLLSMKPLRLICNPSCAKITYSISRKFVAFWLVDSYWINSCFLYPSMPFDRTKCVSNNQLWDMEFILHLRFIYSTQLPFVGYYYCM